MDVGNIFNQSITGIDQDNLFLVHTGSLYTSIHFTNHRVWMKIRYYEINNKYINKKKTEIKTLSLIKQHF